MILSHFKLMRRSLLVKDQCRKFSLTGVRCEDSEDDKKEAAKRKLNSLLESIIKEPTPTSVEQELPKETKFIRKQKRKEDKPKTLGEKVVIAVKDVAATIKGDPDKTSAEILHKLLYKDERLHKSVLKAAGKSNLSELLSGMNVEAEQPKKEVKQITEKFSRAENVRGMVKSRLSKSPLHAIVAERIDIFGVPPPKWFKTKDVPAVNLPTWEHCDVEKKRLLVTVPPSNIWEQMIIWTDRGMLWKFPIDNEQGMDHEKEIHFSEHVFLESHLEGWCPEKGPIRHFMELVCVGLSRNHWYTAQEKKDHIMWYKEYFSSKKELIKELGAGEIQTDAAQSI